MDFFLIIKDTFSVGCEGQVYCETRIKLGIRGKFQFVD